MLLPQNQLRYIFGVIFSGLLLSITINMINMTQNSGLSFTEKRKNLSIYRKGNETTGKVISVKTTQAVRYGVPLDWYTVEYTTAAGETVRVSFLTSGENIYPPSAKKIYPKAGKEFRLRYLPDNPQDLVILADSNIERCYALRFERTELQNRLDFDPDNQNARALLENVRQEYAALDCAGK